MSSRSASKHALFSCENHPKSFPSPSRFQSIRNEREERLRKNQLLNFSLQHGAVKRFRKSEALGEKLTSYAPRKAPSSTH